MAVRMERPVLQPLARLRMPKSAASRRMSPLASSSFRPMTLLASTSESWPSNPSRSFASQWLRRSDSMGRGST